MKIVFVWLLLFCSLAHAKFIVNNSNGCYTPLKEVYYRMPSGSMMPLIEVGNYLRVKEWGDVSHKECKQLYRGMVYVFSDPKNPKIKYVKRLIGLPGDIIEYRDRTLTINRKKIKRTFLREWSYRSRKFAVYEEEIDGLEIETLEEIGRNVKSASYSFKRKVAENKYLFMGDNRDHSKDSRFIGDIPIEMIHGKVDGILEQ